MTHNEVAAAMKAEDVDAGLVEKAARAMYAADPYSHLGVPIPWDGLDQADIDELQQHSRHALAAVLPEIQAQALREREGLRGEVEAFRDDLTALREGLMERIGRYTPSDADLLAYVDTLKAQIANQESAGATQGGSGDSRTLADRLRAAADYQDRPGAYDELRAMADEADRLEADLRFTADRANLSESSYQQLMREQHAETPTESPFRMPEDRCQEHGTTRPCRHCAGTEQGLP